MSWPTTGRSLQQMCTDNFTQLRLVPPDLVFYEGEALSTRPSMSPLPSSQASLRGHNLHRKRICGRSIPLQPYCSEPSSSYVTLRLNAPATPAPATPPIRLQ